MGLRLLRCLTHCVQLMLYDAFAFRVCYSRGCFYVVRLMPRFLRMKRVCCVRMRFLRMILCVFDIAGTIMFVATHGNASLCLNLMIACVCCVRMRFLLWCYAFSCVIAGI